MSNAEAAIAKMAPLDASKNPPQDLNLTSVGDKNESPAPAVESKPNTAQPILPEVTIVQARNQADHDKFIESMAATIRKATRRDNFVDTGTDEKAIFLALQDLSESDRKDLARVYERKYKVSLPNEIKREMSGSQETRALDLLTRKDSSNGEAQNFRHMIQEANQWVVGRGKGNIAATITDKISTMSEADILKLEDDYKQLYGRNFTSAFLTEGKFDKDTNLFMSILLKGADKITTKDHLDMANIALRKGDVEMFQRVATGFSPEARQQFISNGGEKRVKDAFGGHWYNALTIGLTGNVSDKHLRHATDYMKSGHLSAATKLQDNSGTLGDNEKAIEDALQNMSPEERQSYKAAREAIQAKKEVSAADRKVYTDLQARMKDAGNNTERAAWEAMILYPNSKLAKDLLGHKGIIYDDSTNKIITSIENIGKEDWDMLKSNPQFRTDMEAILKPYLSNGQMKRAIESFDRLQKVESYDALHKTGQRSIEHSIKDNTGIFSNNEAGIVDALSKMLPDEQHRYRTESAFRTKIDRQVRAAVGFGAEGDAAQAVLKRIMNNENPALTVVDKINMASAKFNVHEAKVIKDLQQAFKENPDMVRMVNQPKDAKEQEFVKSLNTALRRALSPYEYDRYAKPLMATGKLDIGTQNELSDKFLHTDKKALVDNIVTVDNAQRELLLSTDKTNKQAMELQERTFGGMNQNLADFAKVVLQQRAFGPEDRIRSFVLGAGTTKEETLEQLGKMTTEQKTQVFERYATKYGGSLTSDVMNKLKSQDRDLGELVARSHALSADEQLNVVLANHSDSRRGVGKYFVDNAWDGTGFQSDEARNLMVQAMRKAQIAGTDLDPNSALTYSRRSVDTLNLYRDSKAKFGEVATDVAITALAIGGAWATAGASLTLLAKVGIAGGVGAAVKIGGKSLISGSDYDWSARQVGLDGGVGFVYGATAFLGSQALAKALGVGSAAGATATELAQASIARMTTGGGSMIIEGGENVIREGMTSIVRNMLLRGASQAPADALTALAGQVATKGNEQAVRLALQISLAQSLQQTAMSTGTAVAIEYGIPTAAGAMSGGTAGTIRGAAEWNPDIPIDENLANVGKHAATSAAIGGVSALTFKLGTKAVAVGYDALTSTAGADQLANNPEGYINDRASDVGIFKKKPVVLKAVQAKEPTTIQTLEGPVQANQGDWIMTGVKGENWPVRPDVFARSYDPVAGAADMYQKKPIAIMAVQIDQAMNILDPAGKVKYQGTAGDWLVIGLNGDKYFVKPDIFAATYAAADPVAQRTSAAAEAAIARAATAASASATDAAASTIARADDFLEKRAADLMPFRKAPVELKAAQAKVEQMVETWEGPQKAEVGDWIMTGVKGEQWPIKPEVFQKSYEATSTPGVYRKLPIDVKAVQIDQPMQIFENGTLKFTGKPTDWLVVNFNGKPYFVDNGVFQQTFNAIEGQAK